MKEKMKTGAETVHTCKLIEPNSKYLSGNIEYLKELRDEGEMPEDGFDERIALRKDIETYLKSLEELDKDNIGLHVYWLVDGDKFIGVLRLNERLNDVQRERGGNIGYMIRPSEYGKGYGTKILKLGLEKAKELGMSEVLIDCREDNLASKRIIEKNNGEFVERTKDEQGGPDSLKYAIRL